VKLPIPKQSRTVLRDVRIAVGLVALVLAGTLVLIGIPGPVPLETLSTEGPWWIGDGKNAPRVLASTSLTELASSVQAVPSQPTIEECGHPRYAWQRKAGCWDLSNVPSNTLFLAVLLSPHGGCIYGTLQGAALSVRTLTVNDELAGSFGLSPNCVTSGYALAAIPLSRLPNGNITVVIHYVGVALNCGCSFPDARATANIPWHVP
jgi:hypothetical protein